MNKELLAEFRWKRKVHEMWKDRQATWEEYRNVVRACRDATRKAKAHLELKLARDVKNNKCFFNYISSKRKARDNVGPLLNEVSVLVTEHTEKAELLNAFFASVYQCQGRPSGIPGPGGKTRRSLGQGGLREGLLKRSRRPRIHGLQWNAPTSAEGAGGCHS